MRTKNQSQNVALQLFDQLSNQIYYGMRFRQVLRDNPEAAKAAETLVREMKSGGLEGYDPREL